MIELYAEATFEASHTLPDSVGGIDRVHGHSYWLRVYVESRRGNEMPMPALQQQVRFAAASLDHRHLNDVLAGPTMEAIAEYVGGRIPNATRVSVWRESIGCGVEWKR